MSIPSGNNNLSDVTSDVIEAEIVRVRAMLEGEMRRAGLPVPLGPPRQICPSDGSRGAGTSAWPPLPSPRK